MRYTKAGNRAILYVHAYWTSARTNRVDDGSYGSYGFLNDAVSFGRAGGAFVNEVLSGFTVTVDAAFIPLAVPAFTQHPEAKQRAEDGPISRCC